LNCHTPAIVESHLAVKYRLVSPATDRRRAAKQFKLVKGFIPQNHRFVKAVHRCGSLSSRFHDRGQHNAGPP